MRKKIRNIDFTILDWIQSKCRCRTMDCIMPKVTMLADKGIMWILLALAMTAYKPLRYCGVMLITGLLSGVIIGNVIIKNLVARDRPCWINERSDMLISIPPDYSFPSGHTLASIISSVILMDSVKSLGILAVVISAGIAFSRMYLYVHFPSDILGGTILGIFISYLVIDFIPH